MLIGIAARAALVNAVGAIWFLQVANAEQALTARAADIAEDSNSVNRFPPGCAATIKGNGSSRSWQLPRASLVITNNRAHAIRVSIVARAGTGPAGTELGDIEAGETKTFPHVLPAGRSFVQVEAARWTRKMSIARQVVYIFNRGPLTCRRQFVWTIR